MLSLFFLRLKGTENIFQVRWVHIATGCNINIHGNYLIFFRNLKLVSLLNYIKLIRAFIAPPQDYMINCNIVKIKMTLNSVSYLFLLCKTKNKILYFIYYWPKTKVDLSLLKKFFWLFSFSRKSMKNKFTTIVQGDPKVPFSITTSVGEGATPFPELLHFTLDPYLIMPSVKQGRTKYHFLSLWYDSTWDWTQVSRAIGKHSKPKLGTKHILFDSQTFQPHKISLNY